MGEEGDGLDVFCTVGVQFVSFQSGGNVTICFSFGMFSSLLGPLSVLSTFL